MNISHYETCGFELLDDHGAVSNSKTAALEKPATTAVAATSEQVQPTPDKIERRPGGYTTVWHIHPDQLKDLRPAGRAAAAPELRYESRSLAELGRTAPPVGTPEFTAATAHAIADVDRPLLRELAQSRPFEVLQAAIQADNPHAVRVLKDLALEDYDNQQPRFPAGTVPNARVRYTEAPYTPLFNLHAADAEGNVLHHYVRSAQVLKELGQFPKSRLNPRNAAGETPFYLAARNGDERLLGAYMNEYSVASRFNPKLKQERLHRPATNGDTPLHAAVRSGNMRAIRSVCAAGADSSRKNNVSETAYDLAKKLDFAAAADHLQPAAHRASIAAHASAFDLQNTHREATSQDGLAFLQTAVLGTAPTPAFVNYFERAFEHKAATQQG